jgi:hypothetical protein
MDRMSLSIYMKGDYEDLYALKAAKNKPNSKPIKSNFLKAGPSLVIGKSGRMAAE